MKKRSAKKARELPAQSGETSSRRQVFMSHATHDKWVAVEICRKIEERGVTTFRDDRDIQGGDSIPEAIADAIEDCDELTVLLTPESCGREWVIAEVAMAYVLKKRIVGIMYMSARRVRLPFCGSTCRACFTSTS